MKVQNLNIQNLWRLRCSQRTKFGHSIVQIKSKIWIFKSDKGFLVHNIITFIISYFIIEVVIFEITLLGTTQSQKNIQVALFQINKCK